MNLSFMEMESLVDDLGADTFVWSVGGDVPLRMFAPNMATKFGVSVVATENNVDARIYGPDGKDVDGQTSVPITVSGYTRDKSAVVMGTI